MSDIAVAAVLAGAVLLASMISVEAGLSVALIELVAGFVLGNALSLDVPSWLGFIGTFAGVLPNPPLSADAVAFICEPAVANNSALEQALHPKLTPLREGLATYLK